MFGIILSALNVVLKFVYSFAVIKFVVFVALFVVTTGVTTYVISLIPDPGGIRQGIASLGSGVLYFVEFFGLDVGINAVLSAYATRFIIRRIPLMG